MTARHAGRSQLRARDPGDSCSGALAQGRGPAGRAPAQGRAGRPPAASRTAAATAEDTFGLNTDGMM